jgi:hypothetical protein
MILIFKKPMDNNLISLDNSLFIIKKKYIFLIINYVVTNSYLTIIYNNQIIYTKSLGCLRIYKRDRRKKNKITKLLKKGFKELFFLIKKKKINVNSLIVIIKNVLNLKNKYKHFRKIFKFSNKEHRFRIKKK